MNGLSSQLGEIEAIAASVTAMQPVAEIVICTPATLITRAVRIAEGRIGIGGQDCHAAVSGAFTGDISAQMLKDAGACSVIVGHSERRQHHGETDAMVAAKAAAAWRAGLQVILCIGETQAQRADGKALTVCPKGRLHLLQPSPMSRCGRSALDTYRIRSKSSKCMRISASASSGV